MLSGCVNTTLQATRKKKKLTQVSKCWWPVLYIKKLLKVIKHTRRELCLFLNIDIKKQTPTQITHFIFHIETKTTRNHLATVFQHSCLRTLTNYTELPEAKKCPKDHHFSPSNPPPPLQAQPVLHRAVALEIPRFSRRTPRRELLKWLLQGVESSHQRRALG